MPKTKKVRGRRAQAQALKNEVDVKPNSRKAAREQKAEQKRLKQQEKKLKKGKKDEVTDVFDDDEVELKIYESAEDYEQEKQQIVAESQQDQDKSSNDSDDETENEQEEDSDNGRETDNDLRQDQPAFFGLLTKPELEYFKQAESTIAVNGFANSEEREGFISGVFEEAKKKELKLVTHQICSKLIERLILLGNKDQIKTMFNNMLGHFLPVIKHKYASHCVETLLVRSAALIELEMAESSSESDLSMESLFLSTLNEIKPELSSLLDHDYGSHVIRVILLILSGSTLPSTTTASILRSRKSKIARKMISIKDNEDYKRSYQTPSSFKPALAGIISIYTSNQTLKGARELAIHKISSPVIQLIIKIECTSKQFKKNPILTNQIFSENEKESAFVEYLLSDPVGSHFFEAVIEYLPIKLIERLYNLYMSDRIDKLSRRDNGNYVIQALLKKLKSSQKLLPAILDSLIPEIETLLNSNSLVMVRTVVDTCHEFQDYNMDTINQIIAKKYDIEQNPSELLEKVLQLSNSTLGNTKGDWPTNEEMHRSLLLQSLVKSSPKLLQYTLDGLIELDKARLIEMTKHSVFSHVIESCLQPTADMIQRRKLTNQFVGSFVDMSCNAYGSHIIDLFWKFTFKLKFFRERIADELIKETEKVKNSMYGKRVWRNWNLDKYVRKRFEWWKIVKDQEDQISDQLGLVNTKKRKVDF